MSTTTATRTKATHLRNEETIAESRKFLDQGVSVMQQLRLNGIEQRDKELVVINMLNDVNNDQNPAWQEVMATVRKRAAQSQVSSEVIVGRIADHLFKRLGSASAS